jgi:threonine dehydrogenase-like Zn-dependent dehydrogenase
MAFAQMMNVNVIAMDINEDRLAFCRDNLGIEQTIDARNNPQQALLDTLGEMPTSVFDATGNRQSMMTAFEYVAHTGQLVYVGLVRDDISFNDPYFHSHELTLKSSRNATGSDFEWVIDALANDKIKVDKWITHHVQAEQLPTQFASWLKPETGVIKAMLDF